MAELVINELNDNLPNGCELVELRVVGVGSTAGYVLSDRGHASQVARWPSSCATWVK